MRSHVTYETCARVQQPDGRHLLVQGAFEEQQPLAALLAAQGLAPHLREFVLYALAMADADQEPGTRGVLAQAGTAAGEVQGAPHAAQSREPSQERSGAGASEPAATGGQPGRPCSGRAEPGQAGAESTPAAASRQDRSPAVLASAAAGQNSTVGTSTHGAACPGAMTDARGQDGRGAEAEQDGVEAGQQHRPGAAGGGSQRSGGGSHNHGPGLEASGGGLSAAHGRAALALYLESAGRCAKRAPGNGIASMC